MDQQTAESFMYVARLHFEAMARERKANALERIKRQRFFSPIAAPVDEAAAAFICHITTPEIEPQLADDADDLDWLIDSLDPISCQPDELDRLFHQCRRAGDVEKAAYLIGCRDVRMRISLLEGTDEWRALESVAEK
ncbi:MAG: hypothetical protein WCB97_08880, partial [Thiobacillus sp.]